MNVECNQEVCAINHDPTAVSGIIIFLLIPVCKLCKNVLHLPLKQAAQDKGILLTTLGCLNLETAVGHGFIV